MLVENNPINLPAPHPNALSIIETFDVEASPIPGEALSTRNRLSEIRCAAKSHGSA
jgi:hypothetical protein